MKKLVWSDVAVSDLESIQSYIARDSEVYADAVILEVLDSAEHLIRFPDTGRFVPELENGLTRELIVGNYRLMYEVVVDAVHILTVLHGARQFPYE